MQLRTARLCLDCEELHEDIQCPICASEEFVFLTRWVPVSERRLRQRAPAREPRIAKRVVTGASISLALVGAQWLWSRLNKPIETPAPAEPRRRRQDAVATRPEASPDAPPQLDPRREGRG